MKYDVDNDYEFEYDDWGMPYFPKNVTEDGNLYILPNGKYLPSGCYIMKDGSSLIYEPPQLNPYADMIAQFKK